MKKQLVNHDLRISVTSLSFSLFLFVLFFLLSFKAAAQSWASFYPSEEQQELSAGNLTDSSLKNYLAKIIQRGQRVLGYDRARVLLFGSLSLERDQRGYFIRDVYCGEIFRQEAGVGPMQIPKNGLLNCEHTWPQSKFSHRFPEKTQKSDLHHLFPTSASANSTRSSFDFGEVENGPRVREVCDDVYLGNMSRAVDFTPLARGLFFSPPEDHRGNVARALFYFAVRYQMSIDAAEEYFLRKWHQEDPVDEAERDRNDHIMEMQGNRNPFIDYPELVERIGDF